MLGQVGKGLQVERKHLSPEAEQRKEGWTGRWAVGSRAPQRCASKVEEAFTQ